MPVHGGRELEPVGDVHGDGGPLRHLDEGAGVLAVVAVHGERAAVDGAADQAGLEIDGPAIAETDYLARAGVGEPARRSRAASLFTDNPRGARREAPRPSLTADWIPAAQRMRRTIRRETAPPTPPGGTDQRAARGGPPPASSPPTDAWADASIRGVPAAARRRRPSPSPPAGPRAPCACPPRCPAARCARPTPFRRAKPRR